MKGLKVKPVRIKYTLQDHRRLSIYIFRVKKYRFMVCEDGTNSSRLTCPFNPIVLQAVRSRLSSTPMILFSGRAALPLLYFVKSPLLARALILHSFPAQEHLPVMFLYLDMQCLLKCNSKNSPDDLCKLCCVIFSPICTSVADPDLDPTDPHVFGPPGSGSVSQRYVSGSFYHHAKIVRKTLIPTIL
jgi:hypothetical protein